MTGEMIPISNSHTHTHTRERREREREIYTKRMVKKHMKKFNLNSN